MGIEPNQILIVEDPTRSIAQTRWSTDEIIGEYIIHERQSPTRSCRKTVKHRRANTNRSNLPDKEQTNASPVRASAVTSSIGREPTVCLQTQPQQDRITEPQQRTLT